MKLRLKYVGIGLFLAGLIFTLNSEFNFINNGSPSESSTEKALEQKEAEIKKLRTELESIKKDRLDTKTQDSNEGNNEGVSESISNTEKDIIKATVLIYENMSLYEIGQQVEDLNLLDNGRQLELFLSKPGYSRIIQKGSFELSSDMTIEEMANILTGKTAQ